MRIALVEMASADYLNTYSLFKIPRGVQLLAAILEKDGYAVDCFVETVQRFSRLDLAGYNLIGFSIISCTANPTYIMIRKLREAGYRGTIVVGGPHATALPEESLRAGADVVVRHEGDKTLVQLVKAIEKLQGLDNVLGIVWKKDEEIRYNPDQPFLSEIELSALPLPAFRSIRGFSKMRHISFTLSRGCQFDCDFCAVRAMFGKEYRSATVDWRISQLRMLRDQYPEFWANCSIFFADDNFFGGQSGKAITIEMLKRMIAENLIPPIGWLCQMRVTDASLELVDLMKKAGCIMVCLGIESANTDTLRAFHKGQTLEQIRDGLANLQSLGIKTLAMTIAGADTDTFWSFFRGIRQLHKWGITYLQIVALIPIPGTAMAKRLIAEKRRFSLNYDRYNGMHVLMKPKRMSKIGVFMSVYFVTGWFYFLTSHGRKLSCRKFKEYWRMTTLIFEQFLIWSWRAIKERFSFR